ncbi:PREDICTED: putative beta-glucosidase 5 [Camelina sativa]|uniref:beta-glucosidase n=1 Tax=Camelina sativa TaxID=90675 RepID=A0ABM1RPB7_CAMSA|nr:PREDICTED: putative beta-glucosidase 5 [Camelina sativa]
MFRTLFGLEIIVLDRSEVRIHLTVEPSQLLGVVPRGYIDCSIIVFLFWLILDSPGRCSIPGQNCLVGNSSTETYIAGHNLLLAHASVSRLYKQKYQNKQGGSVGFGLYLVEFKPSTSSEDDTIATQRAKDFYFGWFLEPLIFGDYPDTMRRTVGSRLPVFSEEESEQVKGSSDFLGINHYFAASVTSSKSNSGDPDFYSDMGGYYPVAPWTMEAVLEYIKQTYGNPPVYILENGHYLL